MNNRIEQIFELLRKFDEEKMPIALIDKELSNLYLSLMMILLLKKECEENDK